MKVSFFGWLGDVIGREVLLEAGEGDYTVSELRKMLAAQYPHAEADLARPSIRACVDDVIVPEEFVLPPGADVEFFPPLSGG